jgi:hypothetical protein
MTKASPIAGKTGNTLVPIVRTPRRGESSIARSAKYVPTTPAASRGAMADG